MIDSEEPLKSVIDSIEPLISDKWSLKRDSKSVLDSKEPLIKIKQQLQTWPNMASYSETLERNLNKIGSEDQVLEDIEEIGEVLSGKEECLLEVRLGRWAQVRGSLVG